MDRGAWQAIVHRVTRVGDDLATKPPYRINFKKRKVKKLIWKRGKTAEQI